MYHVAILCGHLVLYGEPTVCGEHVRCVGPDEPGELLTIILQPTRLEHQDFVLAIAANPDGRSVVDKETACRIYQKGDTTEANRFHLCVINWHLP